MDRTSHPLILSISLYVYSSYISQLSQSNHMIKSNRIFFLSIFKGFYLHHLDKALSVRKLEINWRPPEEYFFSVGIVDVPDPDVFVAPEDAPVKKSTPFIEESSPIKPSLFWGCFGGKSKKLSSKIKKTIKQNSRV